MIGKLYLVATPIGNLEDITFRAIRILKTVELIAAEDTRHSGKLLQHYQIYTPTLSYHQHNNKARLKEILTVLKQGKNVALISDAGIPIISDPGYELVEVCLKENIKIIPIPGANAALTALIASGVSCEKFIFEGFLPKKNKLRSDILTSLKRETRTMIFYESPHHLQKTLIDFQEYFGARRKIVLARELTKLYEEFWRGNIEDAIAFYEDLHRPKGEYTIVLSGASQKEKLQLTETEIKQELANLLQQGMSKTEASRELAQFTSFSKRQIYQFALEISS
jgi:16S rRNA (cytidine1402-2'-O)-methyltransferase